MIAVLVALLLSGQPRETITAIEVHGNTVTPDDEIRKIAGLTAGASFEPATLEDAAARLRSSKRFQRVEVLKR
ncbi:MAG TPA: FtsQ-type POTRA domain-containing protein, partial [Vicinamibacterales bacterium]